jgi:hypothetical protein
MPAVTCEAGPTAALVEHGPDLVTGIATSIAAWTAAPPALVK